MLNAFIFSLLSSFLPLILGGGFVLLIGHYKEKISDFFLSFSAGTILGLLCFDLFPESYEVSMEAEAAGFLYWILAFGGVLGLLFLLHFIIEKIFHEKHGEEKHHEHSHIEAYLESKNSYKFAGIALVIAMFFHNFPEGMSLGATLSHDLNEGISLTSYLGLHNFAMGITMMSSLDASNMKKWKSWLLIILSSLPFILGSVIGFISLNENAYVELFILALSSSILTFVLIEEVLPNFKKGKSLLYQLLSLLFGFLLAMLLHFLL